MKLASQRLGQSRQKVFLLFETCLLIEEFGHPSPRSVPAGCRGIRHWDSVNPSNSYLVCGPLWGQDSLVDPAGGVLQMPHYRWGVGMACIDDDVVC